MWALRDFNENSLCMEKILHIFLNLKKNVLSLKGELFRLDGNVANAMEDAFYSQWRMVN
jgi:hypothetical protein